MIEIGKNFVWSLGRAKQQSQQERSKYKSLAQQAQQEAQALQQDYEEKMNYLFRSSVERSQLAYENARKQVALLQARRAANGVTDRSASAVDEKQTSTLQQAQAHQQIQADLTQRAVEQTNLFESKWKQLQEAFSSYYKRSKRKSRLGSFGRAIMSLLK